MPPTRKIGRYNIINKLGEGGMGEVYLAEDAKLERQVALKILPDRVAEDADRILRFEHEAKSASALNHPNIVTIYEIGDEDGSLFIAMEHVDGRTLGKTIRSGELDIRSILGIAIQIAGALAASHQANVIHRDIKPDNIIIRPDGLVKVLDFGLAKLTEKMTDEEIDTLPTLFKTSPGLVMGTVGYMSPEQARGKEVDGRSDIFSFGSILYEMLAGRRPFTGENEVDVIASILHKEPAPLDLPAGSVGAELESLIRKTLRKDREERYQTVPELLADLRELRQRLTGDTVAPVTGDYEHTYPTGSGSRRTASGAHSISPNSSISGAIAHKARLHPVLAAALITASAIVIGFLGTNLYNSWRRADSFQSMRLARLTASGNIVSEQTAISPDGRYIAYVTAENDGQSLWVKQAAAAASVQIVPPAEVRYDGLAFSPDGVHVYYTLFDKDGASSLNQVQALGGPSRKILSDLAGPASILPDGSRIAFIRKEKSILTATPDGSDERIVATAGDGRRYFRVAWSPDAKNIMAAAFFPSDSRDHLVEISTETGAERTLPTEWLRVRGLAWLPDGGGLVVSGRDPETQLSQLWLVNYPSGGRRRITNDLSNYQGVSIAADGETIASVQENIVSNIWTLRAGDTEPRQLTSDLGRDEGMSGIALAPDGRVVYTVREREMQDLWIVNPDGTGVRQLTFSAQSNFSPTVTPDGRYIVFVSSRAGSPDLWRMDIDGGNPLQLTREPGGEIEPSIPADGRWVIYQRVNEKNESSVWKIGLDGGEPILVSEAAARRPSASPDGKLVAFDRFAPTPAKLSVLSLEDGGAVRELDMPAVLKSRTFRWSADTRSLLFVEARDRVYNLWSQPIAGGPPVRITNFDSDRIFRFDAARDGGGFAFARGSESSDAVMISNFR